MKSKVFVVLGVILCLVIGGFVLYSWDNYEEVYYTQIDNAKIKKLDTTDNMKYEYTLNSYNERGKLKKLKFKTTRELREDAYLLLKVRSFGVHSWEEVSLEDIPQMAQNRLK